MVTPLAPQLSPKKSSKKRKVESMDVSQKKICVKKIGSTMSHPMAPLEMIDHLELVIDENALEEAEKQK